MNINNFARAMQGAGVKPSLFEVQGSIGGNQSDLTPFLVRSASLPGTVLGSIEVPFRGRRIKLPGDRQFADWTISIINDGKFELRNAFETWVNNIQGVDSNTGVGAFVDQPPFNIPLFQDWTVNQLDRAGKPIKAYKLVGCFPTDISPIDLSYDASDQIEEFSVTLAYSYFVSNAGAVGVSDRNVGLIPLTETN